MDQSSPTPAPPADDQFRALADSSPDAVLTIDADGVVRFANPAVEDVLGYPPDELVGSPLTRIMDDEIAEEHRSGLARYVETGERRFDWTDARFPGRRKDGTEVPLRVSFGEFTADGERFFTGVVRDATERKHRERQLSALHEFAQSLTAAETAEGVYHLAMATANELLPNLLATAYRYDEAAGRLVPASHTPAVLNVGPEDGELFSVDHSLPWTAFQRQERRVCTDTRTDDDVPESATPLRSVVAVPFGSHGVLVAGSTATEAFDREAVRLLDLLAADVETALDRVEREATLRERAAELEEHAAALERVNRVNDVIRGLTTALVRAESREEIEQTVCTKLANASAYRFAWIGSPTATGEVVTPRASAGVERGYLDALAGADGEGSNVGEPGRRAIATREVQVRDDLSADPPFEPWRDEALQRGYRSCIAVPLRYGDVLYGVLQLYSSEPAAFDDLAVAVLAELGEMVAYAINAVERKNVVVSDSTVELTFDIDDPGILPARLAAETDSRFEFESLVEQSDGSLRVFFSIEGAEPDVVQEYHDRGLEVETVEHVSEREDGHLFEATLGAESFLASLLGYGTRPTELTATPAGTELTVELPQSGDVQAFLRMLLDTYEDVTLRTRRELDRPVRSDAEFRAHYRDRLTEREAEVLQTAYYAGFFESPRRSSGSEVAEMLGVSQPTVNRHLRRGERKLLEMVFDERGDSE